MFDFLKRKKETDTTENQSTTEDPQPLTPSVEPTNDKPAGLFAKLKQGLTKTRASFATGITNLFLGKKELNADLLDEIEMVLLTADVGVETTEQLIQTLTQKLARKELSDAQAAFDCLQQEMKAILLPCDVPLAIPPQTKPYVILVVGINGSGKTTTIGKLASHFKEQQKQVMLAAGDTFRAAAIEQLQVWGERNHIPVIAQQPGADTAAVIYDAMEAAKARGADVLIADTAGRLHTQSNLMAELQKVKRVLAKIDPAVPHETLIVLDATLGQNALNQVKQFHQAVGVTGIALTKLDGTAKGGIIFAIAKETKIPIRFIGIGEGIADLRPFQADAFVDALFSR
jgi:fused signal recognition particle receptor